MSTKAEIEAEIARLRARLERVEIDPAFTPAELVRWDPSLLGAVLRIKHERNIPKDAFDIIYSAKSYNGGTGNLDDACGSMTQVINAPSGGRVTTDEKMEMVGVLIGSGLRFIKTVEPRQTTKGIVPGLDYKFATTNEFELMTRLPLLVGVVHQTAPPASHNLSCKALGLTLVKHGPSGNLWNYMLPLANPDRFLLDQIFVATSTRVHETDILVDKYPLSTLYNEWKRDKDAAPDYIQRSKVGGRPPVATRPTLPPQRKTELDNVRALLAELQGEVRALQAALQAARSSDEEAARDLADKNERLREALHIAVQTPNMGGFVPVGNATASGSTNATAATNATADPM